MRKTVCTLLAIMLAMLSGCANSNEEADANIDQANAAGGSVVINNNGYLDNFDYYALSEKTGVKISVTDYMEDEFFLKILAGDSDVDIYFIRPANILQLSEKGIYYPFESQSISDFNDSCFDYISEFCDVDGKTVYMPVNSSFAAILMPKAAIEETGMTSSDIEFLDGYFSFARSYQGDRIAFTNGALLFMNLEGQYQHFYCDFANGKFDYMTPEYLNLYEKMLSGYLRYAQEPGAPEGFMHNISGISSNSNYALMTYGSYWDYSSFNEKNDGTDIVDATGPSSFFDKWRAFPVPKISSKITQNNVSATYAMINPYSNNKEAAVKVLEEIAANYYDYAGYYNRFSFMFEDRSAYPEHYRPDSEIFGDFFNIAANGFIFPYQVFTSHPDIEEYQNGRATLEEAVAMYQREVEMWLNE